MEEVKPEVGHSYHLFTQEEAARALQEAKDKAAKTTKYEDRWHNFKWFRNIGKPVELEPSHPMPKTYSCPTCNATSRRISKTITGANYHCRTHGNFLIVNSGLVETANVR